MRRDSTAVTPQNTTRNEPNSRFSNSKVTLLVDTKVNAILDLHVTTTRKHDSQIAPSLIKRNPEDIDILLGDKGYDDHKIRRLCPSIRGSATNQAS